MSRPRWHDRSAAAVRDQLATGHEGLDPAEAARRLEQHGPNEIIGAGGVSARAILAAQFANLLIVILLAATVASAFLGHRVEAVAIAVIVGFAIVLGFVQEYRAERAIAALHKMTAPTARALRGGREVAIPARELVTGDLVLIGTGDRVPADLRIDDATNLEIDESALTGESVPVAKQTGTLAGAEIAVGDQTNMAFSGTDVTYGRGHGIVVATGMSTEFGAITRLLSEVKPSPTPLQQNLDRVGRWLGVAAGLIVLLIVGAGLARGAPVVEMLVFGIALAVAVVPEALPAVVTISLAIGVQRLVRRNALVRHLPTVETLGSTTVICSDKTGTLTRNEMTVQELWTASGVVTVSGGGYAPEGRFEPELAPDQGADVVAEMLRAGALASDARLLRADDRWVIAGDPTEGALVVAAAKAGLEREGLERALPRVAEVPFTSERKRMTTLHQGPGHLVAYAKGAPEVLLASSNDLMTAAGPTPLSDERRSEIARAAEAMAARALRVIAVARKHTASLEGAEDRMTFLGLFGLLDPPRDEARGAVQICMKAGIKPVMITGDHPRTAEAVARALGIVRGGRIVTGAELDRMDDDELAGAVEEIDVFSRVSPEHKLRVVAAWQARGHIVGMTGDGVNDAPALKKADIGVAMGISGTDVSREAADMTLTDDNFASIVGAVEEGRAIFSNIKKYLMYLLSSNIGEIGLMAGATLAGWPLPLTAVQILYVNLATDGLPALALAVDPPETDLMLRRPRSARRSIFTPPVLALMLAGGVWSTAANLALFGWARQSGRSLSEAMTMTFASLVLIQFFKAYSFRSDRESVFVRPLANRWLNLAIGWELILLVLIVHLPLLHAPFSTYGLSLTDWAIVVTVSATVTPVLEATKWLVRRGWLGDDGRGPVPVPS